MSAKKVKETPQQKLNVYIRQMERRDIPKVTNWMTGADYKTTQLINYPINDLKLLKNELLKNIAVSKLIAPSTQILTAEVNGEILVGVIFIQNIDWRSRHCDLQIYIQPEFRQSDLPLIITTQVYGYIFSEMNMHKIYTYCTDQDKEIIQAHKNHGHEPEAILYDYVPGGKKLCDLYIYGTFKRDVVKS